MLLELPTQDGKDSRMPTVASLIILVLLGTPGVRLLAAAARERRAAELWCGLFFTTVAVGISGRIFAVSHRFSDPDGVLLIDNGSHAFLSIGLVCLVVFIVRVFHPEDPGARVAAGFVIAASVGTGGYAIWERATIGEQPITVILTNATRLAPLAWAFFESHRYWRNMQRREALGLADPIVRNRFGLWTLWTAGVTVVPIVALVMRIAVLSIYGPQGIEDGSVAAILPTLLGVVRGLFLLVLPISMGALWLSFFPPQSYLARVQRRAADAPSA